jgi:hypothetical protein
VANKDWRLIELGKQWDDNVCISLGADHIIGRRRCTKAGEIRRQGGQTGQAVLEIGTTPTPSMKR